MKKILIPVSVFALVWTACEPNSSYTNTSTDSIVPKGEVTKTSYDPTKSWMLDDLLNVADQKKLTELYGAKNIQNDTIWGDEGMFVMGTLLFPKTADQVEIIWKDTLQNAQMASATIHVPYSEDSTRKDTVHWSTRLGVKLRMSIADIEQINGKPFLINGFGWDYGGYAFDWKAGNLQDKKMTVRFDLGTYDGVSEKEQESILGENEVSSDNVVVRKTSAFVNSVSVNH